ncbi:uncharacterized protein LOC133799443 [Humulus lupulus]|uniref:uncharacterized protein LOC133799443 n=1 Tax=Humulus lupulus TaxID=3486 RepID=UPI002B403E7D|nr:uncharacterized protein LOC133799443 [Humulus lupulus]
MTSCSSFFFSYKPCTGNTKIRIADGSFFAISGVGDAKLSDTLTLSNVLHVPKLSCNLISISKLTSTLNCTAIFSSSYCVFQNPVLETMIGYDLGNVNIRQVGEVNVRENQQENELGNLINIENVENIVPHANSQQLDEQGCNGQNKGKYGQFVSTSKLLSSFATFTNNVSSVQIPNNIQEALLVPEWKGAVFEEMTALEKNQTWKLEDHPKETPTPLRQFDVKNAFLNGRLEEVEYMLPPPGFENKFGMKVSKLEKTFYGLKQSPRTWFERFTQVVKKQGYSQAQSDHTLFTRHSNNGNCSSNCLCW